MYIQLDGQILYYEIEGSGEPMLLLHGNCEDHSVFDNLVAILKDHYTLYLLDSRGHGLSASPKAYHYHDMAMDVIKFIEALSLDRPILLGFSDGAIISLLVGIKRGELISRIISCGANIDPSGIKWSERRAMKKEYKKTKDERVLMMLNEPNISLNEIKYISVPADIVAGENDCIALAHTKKIAASIPDSNLHIIKGETHSSYIANAEKLSDIVFKKG